MLQVISTNYGRGVSSDKILHESEAICTVPCISIDAEDISDTSILWAYIFDTDKPNKYYIALGLGSLFNHSNTPNACWVVGEDMTITYKALKDIASGEEITINYGYDPIDHNLDLRVDSNSQNDKIKLNEYFSFLHKKLEHSNSEVKRSFNELVKYFSFQENTQRANDVKSFYLNLPKDLIFKPTEVGYLRWIKKNITDENIQLAINLATLIVDIDTPICLALTLQIYSDILNKTLTSIPDSITSVEGSPNKKLINLKLSGSVPELGQVESLKAKEWSNCIGVISQYSIDQLELMLAELYQLSGVIGEIDLEGNIDFENFKLTKRSKYDIVLLLNKFNLSDLQVIFKEIKPFNKACSVLKINDHLEYSVPDVPLVQDLPDPSFKVPSNSGLIRLADYLATLFSRCQGRIFINIVPNQGDVVELAKVIITLTDDASLSYITISNKEKTKILFK